ncbi:hypothetical protein CC80DRAFT_491407 [Byssothecium circinans]|uniref:Uncharacterized protein n=1 Tax=Byssothecium circinans TaxID=147558 RepID=A0A6A5U064_9PLEO|nr:hypothetical protein CC80DRAFT_491407 [Byssothecium circinans]
MGARRSHCIHSLNFDVMIQIDAGLEADLEADRESRNRKHPRLATHDVAAESGRYSCPHTVPSCVSTFFRLYFRLYSLQLSIYLRFAMLLTRTDTSMLISPPKTNTCGIIAAFRQNLPSSIGLHLPAVLGLIFPDVRSSKQVLVHNNEACGRSRWR